MFRKLFFSLAATALLTVAGASSAVKPPANHFTAAAQSGTVCGSAAHCTTLNWGETSSCASPCSIVFEVFRGTAPGAESALPINGSPLTAPSYVDPVTLTGAVQVFYYKVQAVETSGSISVASALSAEVSATFPGIPATPTPTATVQ